MKRNPTTQRLIENIRSSRKLRFLVVQVVGRPGGVGARRVRKFAKSFYRKLVDQK